MAADDDHTSSEYVCVDSKMESHMAASTDSNGALFYFTIAQCGSLPCGPYVQNKVLPCVVCSM